MSVMRCSDKWVEKHMLRTPSKRKTVTRQIDYIFVSNRWRSSVTDVKVLWGSSIHRNLHCKDDHALLMCQWCWRLRKVEEKTRRVDWSVRPPSPSTYLGLNPDAASIILNSISPDSPPPFPSSRLLCWSNQTFGRRRRRDDGRGAHCSVPPPS